MQELQARAPDLQPGRMLDFGAGPGTAVWAAAAVPPPPPPCLTPPAGAETSWGCRKFSSSSQWAVPASMRNLAAAHLPLCGGVPAQCFVGRGAQVWGPEALQRVHAVERSLPMMALGNGCGAALRAADPGAPAVRWSRTLSGQAAQQKWPLCLSEPLSPATPGLSQCR